MKYGVIIFPTTYTMTPAELGVAAEERGFESLWFPEHTHIPASRESPWPGGADLPQEYYDTYDLFLALSMAAQATTKLIVGAGICLVIEHDPIVLAKKVATLDHLSDGRFIFGIGGGWNVEEMRNHGTDFKRRWKVMRERIEAMKEIWTKDQAEYHGEFVDFDPIFSNPKPNQKPHPPILIGGAAPWAIKRAVRYCDGWIPIGIRDDITEHIPKMRAMAKEAGRDPDSLSITIFGTLPDKDSISKYEDAGAERCNFFLPSAGADKVLPIMDSLAQLIE